MGKKYFYTLLNLIFVSQTMFAQYKVDGDRQINLLGKRLSDMEYENIQGNVKSILETYGGAVEINGEIQLDSSGYWTTIRTSYDKNGNEIKKEWLKDGTVMTLDNTYDERGNIISVKIISSNGKTSKEKYKYDNEDRVVNYKGDKVLYNKNGLVEKFKNKVYKYEITDQNSLFNQNLNVFSVTKDFAGVSDSIIMQFNQHGLIINEQRKSSITHFETGKVGKVIVDKGDRRKYTYDDRNNILVDGYNRKHIYTYDNYGNWLEDIQYDYENRDYKKLFHINRRFITYYD